MLNWSTPCESSTASDENEKMHLNVAAMVAEAAIENYATNNFRFIEALDFYFDEESRYFYKKGIAKFFHADTSYVYKYNEKQNNGFEWIYDPNWTLAFDVSIDFVIFLIVNDLLSRIEQLENGTSSSLDFQNETLDCMDNNNNNNDDDDDDDDVGGSSFQALKHAEETVDPCIRLMCEDSNEWHFITVTGCRLRINRYDDDDDNDHDRLKILPNRSCDETHCKIEYDENIKKYHLNTLSTHDNDDVRFMLNDVVVVQQHKNDDDDDDDQIWLNHLDRLTVSSNGDVKNQSRFVMHIHRASNTCHGCEPALRIIHNNNNNKTTSPRVDTNETKKYESKQVVMKRQLKLLKNQYGLTNFNEIQVKTPGYEDRAKKRRETIGSDVYLSCIEKPHEISSVFKPISEKNVGFKLLSKMGWKDGESLGRRSCSTVDAKPIIPVIRIGSSGLGYENAETLVGGDVNNAKRVKLLKMRQRFATCVSSPAFDDQ